MDYSFAMGDTPQNQPIFMREDEMTQNLAGGYGFKADPWQVLRRWLLTGSMGNAFYQKKQEMTSENVSVLKELIVDDPAKVGTEIVYASGKGISVHTPILALVILSTGGVNAKKIFRETFPRVIRTGSHLLEFFSYIRGIRGFGNLIHTTVKDWINKKNISDLEYQFLKYQNRYGWTIGDVLRMIKPRPDCKRKNTLGECPVGMGRNALFKWAVGKLNDLAEIPENLKRLRIYEMLKLGMSEIAVINAINFHGLTWEMIPANIERTPAIWEEIFQNMPVTATIRNLGNLTEKGIFTSLKNIDTLESRLEKGNLKKAYIHPVVLASAMKIYIGGGTLGKSKLRWEPVPRVVDILEVAIEEAFENIELTGLHYFHALDVSGSMAGNPLSNLWLQPYEVEGIMALATIRAEKNYFIGGFDTHFCPLMNFRKTTSVSDVMDKNGNIWPDYFGGTDAASAFRYASNHRIYTDVFVLWTDSESWAGSQHPRQALAEYRGKVNQKAKAIYVTLVPYNDKVTLVDPIDPLSYDIAGFTAETPKIIQMIALDEI